MRYFALPAAALLAACAADSFATNDGGSDAGGSADAADAHADGPACTPVAAPCPLNSICTDFDSNGYGTFNDIAIQPGSTQIVQDKFVSCPNAMLASVGQVTGTNVIRAGIGATVTGLNLAQAHATITTDVWLPDQPNGGFIVVALRANNDPVSVVDVEYHAADQTWYLADKVTDKQQSFAPRTGAWNHFILDVTFSSDSGLAQASLTYDEQQSGTPKTIGPINDPNVSGSIISQLTGQIGIETQSTTGALNVYVDNVQFSAPP